MTCHINTATNAVGVEYVSAQWPGKFSQYRISTNTFDYPTRKIKAKLSIGVPVNEAYKELAKVWGIKKLELTTRVSKENILPASQI